MSIDDAHLIAFLLNAAVQIIVIGAGTAIALRLVQSAAARLKYRVATAGLLLCAVVPMLSAWPAARLDDRAKMFASPLDTQALAVAGLATVAVYAYGAWLLWKAVTLSRAVLATASVRRSCTLMADGRIVASFRPFRTAHRAIELGRSALVRTPLVCGVTRPIIVLPDQLLTSDGGVIDAVIAHEYAHIARHDVARGMAIELLTAPFSWHPAIAILKRAAATYRELACDDMAIDDLGLERRTYATALLKLAEFRIANTGFGAMGAGADLERRVQHLLARRGAGRLGVGGQILACACVMASAAIAPLCAVAIDAGRTELSGVWTLDVAHSEPRGRLPFQAAQLRIASAGNRLVIGQQRTRFDGRFETFEIRGSADNVPFEVFLPGSAHVHTRAHWQGNRLITNSAGPGNRWKERWEATVSGNRLIVQTESAYDESRSRTELVFRRE